jgi:hypothetical protein
VGLRAAQRRQARLPWATGEVQARGFGVPQRLAPRPGATAEPGGAGSVTAVAGDVLRLALMACQARNEAPSLAHMA